MLRMMQCFTRIICTALVFPHFEEMPKIAVPHVLYMHQEQRFEKGLICTNSLRTKAGRPISPRGENKRNLRFSF